MVNMSRWERVALFGVAFATTVVLCVCLFRAVKVCGRSESTNAKRSETRKVSNRDRSLHMAESKGWLIRNVDPHRCTVPNDKCQEIKSIFDQMAAAYENRQTNMICELAAKMPGCVTNVPNIVYIELRRNIARQVRDHFLFLEQPYEFENLNDFKVYADNNLLTAEILGDLDLLRREYSIAPRLDAQVVRQLKRYKAKFESEQKLEMALYADQCLRAWREKIDSPGGYIHRYMIFQVSLQLVGRVDWIWEELLGSIRHEADALVSAGYKPKWLDEEFPQSAEWDRKRAVEWERRRWGGRQPRKVPKWVDEKFSAEPSTQH